MLWSQSTDCLYSIRFQTQKKHLHKLLRHVLQEKIHNKYYKIHIQVFWANISIIDGEQIVYSVDNYIHFSKQTTPQTCSH